VGIRLPNTIDDEPIGVTAFYERHFGGPEARLVFVPENNTSVPWRHLEIARQSDLSGLSVLGDVDKSALASGRYIAWHAW